MQKSKKMIKNFIEILSRFGRDFKKSKYEDEETLKNVQHLKDHGFVALNHLVGSPKFLEIKNKINSSIENDLTIEFPCLAQSKINNDKHQDLIKSNFLSTNANLSQRDLTFEKKDIKSYSHMIKEFSPSTLTLGIKDDKLFFDIWLDEKVINIVQSYMGFVPELVEAYTRRNFPCKYKVMNHFWHRDENHKDYLLKAFIFFTDCDQNTGAHHYISGSVKTKNFRDNKYYEDEEIHSIWPEHSKNHMISNVKAGTIIIEDTRGLHKAGTPNIKYRDLGYAVFLPPNFLRKKKPLYTISKLNYENLSENQKLYVPLSNVK